MPELSLVEWFVILGGFGAGAGFIGWLFQIRKLLLRLEEKLDKVL